MSIVRRVPFVAFHFPLGNNNKNKEKFVVSSSESFPLECDFFFFFNSFSFPSSLLFQRRRRRRPSSSVVVVRFFLYFVFVVDDGRWVGYNNRIPQVDHNNNNNIIHNEKKKKTNPSPWRSTFLQLVFSPFSKKKKKKTTKKLEERKKEKKVNSMSWREVLFCFVCGICTIKIVLLLWKKKKQKKKAVSQSVGAAIRHAGRARALQPGISSFLLFSPHSLTHLPWAVQGEWGVSECSSVCVCVFINATQYDDAVHTRRSN